MSISSTQEIVAELRAGRMVILVDEEDRENEGDLVLAADFVTPEAINFMVTHARGLVCLTLTEERCQQLDLSMMTSRNGTSFGTNFTVSIEAAEGVTTGISAADRAKTIQVAVAKGAKPDDIVQPGHIFPLKAQKGGVLMRAGHTEAGCDLTEMAGLTPASVICEIMKDDGTMARLPDLLEFAKDHNLKIGTIADLIHYRSANECLVERVAERSMSTTFGDFRLVAFRDKPSGSAHLAMVHGDLAPNLECLVRVHQPVSILDLLETKATTHSWTMASAMQAIKQSERGVLVLLNCGETADALFAQFAALDTTNTRPNARAASMDLRTYGIGAQILKDLGVGKMQLLASPRKMPSMTGFDLEVTGYLAKPAA
ncbi:3,4-dihydroxy-2-butanone-4-phosphate synthase [Massilia sp. RP-1-19]|uniref:3,4-dihydroxy-2-butanone 4-phosphate synthase n=1 Tax=Massilia polaris TaxID=2728846 RepID=A0A848HSH6_9BURK|nr:bifunctional 3,4-dihydroxy-2-butanone-4-phosphate synthase/GTP cyclohydrolase II [Massilia polaris]NML62223.1 3,4-dihydroxy-2-butanone-4-phosphate synthase [Massilia polaris]